MWKGSKGIAYQFARSSLRKKEGELARGERERTKNQNSINKESKERERYAENSER